MAIWYVYWSEAVSFSPPTWSCFTVARNQAQTKDRIMCGRPHLPTLSLPDPTHRSMYFKRRPKSHLKFFLCEYLTFADQSERNRLIKFNEMEYLYMCCQYPVVGSFGAHKRKGGG